ncbi:hypothetical protein BT93_B1988 [Corymbia citriodora subsp. variegata]|nr:hypothetical protein BT93_B1988 [Corymbia citriodora subsp. variegata]
MPHMALAKMAKKYGPVKYLKMGTCGMVVASTPDAARAFLKTLDINFSSGPPNAGATHLAYDAQDMVFADYGPRWKLYAKSSPPLRESDIIIILRETFLTRDGSQDGGLWRMRCYCPLLFRCILFLNAFE